MIRELPDFLINQIAAGEVVERPASVVKELVENALDAGAGQILIDVSDGGRTMITVIDDGCGMARDDLAKAVLRHATSKLPGDDLLDIGHMGFRGEALPSIASVSDMTIDTRRMQLDCTTMEIRPSSWDAGTRVRVQNLFGKTPARLKFLRGDRAEMMSVVDTVKRLAMARPDVGFVLNNRWRWPVGGGLPHRVIGVMGEDVRGRLIEINAGDDIKLQGFISEPTLRRASSVDQYLFVNGRPVRDKVLVGALRAAYMDVMSAREFPLCALYLTMNPRHVDVNVSPAKTEVHFLEPARVRGFIVKTLRDALGATMTRTVTSDQLPVTSRQIFSNFNDHDFWQVRERAREVMDTNPVSYLLSPVSISAGPLGRVVGQIGNKYIIAQNEAGMVVIDQHAAHERITYEKLRTREIKVQSLLTPIVIELQPERVAAILCIQDELKQSGLGLDRFGDNAVAIFEKPADWDLDWKKLLSDISDEVRDTGASAQLLEKLHLKLANFACHHSVRAGQKLDMVSMDALLRDIENTERAGQCNHGRPVYKIMPISMLDKMFERL